MRDKDGNFTVLAGITNRAGSRLKGKRPDEYGIYRSVSDEDTRKWINKVVKLASQDRKSRAPGSANWTNQSMQLVSVKRSAERSAERTAE